MSLLSVSRDLAAIRRRSLRSPAAGLSLAAVCMLPVLAEEPSLADSIKAKVTEIFDLRKDAVVRVESSDRHGRLSGTGFYADPSGTVYTLAGVVGDGQNITVCQGVRKFPARLQVSDPRTGLAIIKVEANTPFLPIGDSDAVQIATPVISIGYPMGLPETPGFGLVAGFDKEYLNRFFRTTHIRANLPVQRGLGGAPVVNLDGKVIGIIVAGVDGNAGCFMLPINAAEKLRMEYARFGELRPGVIGVSVEDAREPSATSTARVANLRPGTPAEASGIQDGDILLQIGDIKITSKEDIIDASFFLTAGDQTKVVILRGAEQRTFSVRSAEDPYFFQPDTEAERMIQFDSTPILKLEGN